MPGGDDGAGDVAASDFGDLVGVDGVAFGEVHKRDARPDDKDERSDDAQDDPKSFIFTRCSHEALPESREAQPSPGGR